MSVSGTWLYLLWSHGMHCIVKPVVGIDSINCIMLFHNVVHDVKLFRNIHRYFELSNCMSCLHPAFGRMCCSTTSYPRRILAGFWPLRYFGHISACISPFQSLFRAHHFQIIFYSMPMLRLPLRNLITANGVDLFRWERFLWSWPQTSRLHFF